MNLFEISDEFVNTKTTPDEDMKHLSIKEKRLQYEQRYVRHMKDELLKKVVGETKRPNWNEQQPDLPDQMVNIQKVIDAGFAPIYIHDHTSHGEKRLITLFIPRIPQNETIIQKLERVCQREIRVTRMLRDIPTEIRKTKNRLSAWKRKQPTYVSRSTGKELLAEFKKKIEDFLATTKWGSTMHVVIQNNYYWAKNKMIVVELNVRASIPGLSINQTAKQALKPELNKYLEDLGYTQFRFSERYIDSSLTILKIQLDDVEAKNKATEHETT